MDDNASIFTADNTFAGADLSNLKSLDLSNIMFAVSNLSDRCGYYTAFYTFEGANLSALIALNLNSTNF
jgi:hypothetical protein